MVLVVVYGGQRSLAFELTTAILKMEILILVCVWCHVNYGRSYGTVIFISKYT